MKPQKRLRDDINSVTMGVITVISRKLIHPNMFTMSFLLTVHYQIQN